MGAHGERVEASKGVTDTARRRHCVGAAHACVWGRTRAVAQVAEC